MLPIDRIARGISEAHVFAHGFSEHGRVVVLADDPVAILVLFQERRSESEVTKAATAFPANSLTDAPLVRPVDDSLQTRNDVSVAVFTQLHHDPAATHLV